LTIRKLGEKVGIRARPHGLRHAAVTAALDAMKGDIRSVQKFSRHKDVRVLCVYDDQRKDVAGEVSRMISS
jgi:integrase/recombinase XerC